MGNVRRLGVLVGLPFEAAILAPYRFGNMTVRTAAAEPARARREAAALLGAGAELLVSFGVAGGLDPALLPGDLLLADKIVDAEGRSYAADIGARAELLSVLKDERARGGALLGTAEVVATPDAKARLFAESGAAALDMESLPLAEAAAEAGRPFIAVRAVADPAGRAIPGAALAALGKEGRVDFLRLLAALARRPGDLAGFPALARDSARAKAALGRAALGLARAFG